MASLIGGQLAQDQTAHSVLARLRQHILASVVAGADEGSLRNRHRRQQQEQKVQLVSLLALLPTDEAILAVVQKKSALDVAWAFALHIRPQRDRQILGVPWVDRCAELMHGSYAKQFAVCAAQDADMYFSTGQPRQLRLRALVPWCPVVVGPCD